MNDHRTHYETLLADHYSWMSGRSFDETVSSVEVQLSDLGVVPKGCWVDLGCGPGYQSTALRRMGAQDILAVDLSERLLAEARQNDGSPAIRFVHADLMAFADHLDTQETQGVVCMGDTLTHLDSASQVETLIAVIHGRLCVGGSLIFEWRDLSDLPYGTGRFIPVQSDETRILTCFLEDAGDRVDVHDLLHMRTKEGWTLQASVYPKLKLSKSWVLDVLKQNGFDAVAGRSHGTKITIHATKR